MSEGEKLDSWEVLKAWAQPTINGKPLVFDGENWIEDRRFDGMSEDSINYEIKKQQPLYEELSGFVYNETPRKPFSLFHYLQPAVKQRQIRCYGCKGTALEIVLCGDLVGVRCPACGHESNINYE